MAIVATGGLSHQVHGERAGFNNPAWDERFLDLFESDPERLAAMTHAEYAELGGFEGAEVIMWLVMRGAMSPQVRCLHRSYYLPSMTAIATAIYEDVADERAAEPASTRRRDRSGEQLAGIERLPGHATRSRSSAASRAYRINRFLHDLVDARAARRASSPTPEAEFERAGLTDVERDLIRRRDWRGLIHYGVIFFMLEKLAAVVGVSNLHVYAAMRGESLEDFQRTRNAPSALYSVAGKDAGTLGVGSQASRGTVIEAGRR